MDKRVLIDLVRGNPAFQQGVDQIEQKFSDAPITLGDINGLIRFIETVLDHPDKYSQLRAAAITDGKLDGSELPQQFQPQILVPLLVALYGIRDRLQGKEEEEYARGGLTGAARKLRAEGRGGDTVLAHINPKEAAMLKHMGASGTINPKTGLPEYGWSWKSIISTVLPVAIDYFAPGLGTSIGELIPGVSGAAASTIGGSLLGAGLGAGTAALTGGNIGQGALSGGALGALSGGGGEWLGNKVGGMFGQSLSPTVASALGGTLIGGGLGAINGQNVMQSALQGGIGGAIAGSGKTIANKLGAEGAMNAGIQSAARAGGNLLTIGADPQQALISGGLAGLATGLMSNVKPSSAVVDEAKTNMPWQSGDTNKALQSAIPSSQSSYGFKSLSSPASGSSGGMSLGTLGLIGLGGAALLGGSSNPQQAIATSPALSETQKAYFNQPSLRVDWNALSNEAAKNGMDLGSYVAQNWNKVTAGQYSSPIVAKATGGLSKIAYLAKGSGSGRADTIDAKLSDGEYVIDAETVALLGDGSTDEGARKLDQMREQLRKQKGKKLAKGEFSLSAKSPLSYLKGAK